MPTDDLQDAAVLVMNRDDKNVRLTSSLLEKLGLQVLHVSSDSEALDVLNGAGKSAKLLIMDEAATSATVSGFLERARSENHEIPVLIISERDELASAGGWMSQAHVRGFLRKPFRRAKFVGSVLELIGGGALVRTA
jgi:CheY-like chemotaxis protein